MASDDRECNCQPPGTNAVCSFAFHDTDKVVGAAAHEGCRMGGAGAGTWRWHTAASTIC